MAQNIELENVVLGEMYNHTNTQDSALALVDLPHRVRLLVGSFIGHGYDFMRPVDEEDITSTLKAYDKAVKNIKEHPSGEMGKLVAEGIVDNQFGWYVTELPR